MLGQIEAAIGTETGVVVDTGRGSDTPASIQRFVRRLFEKLNSSDFPYLVLRNYQGYPRSLQKPDIGMLIDDRQTERLKRLFKGLCVEQGYGCLVNANFSNGVVATASCFRLNDEGQLIRDFVKVDARAYKTFELTRVHKAVKGYSYKVFYDETWRKLRRQDGCEFYTYDQPDEFIMLFRQWKRKQDTRYRDQIIGCLQEAEVNRWFQQATGVGGARLGHDLFGERYDEDRHDPVVWKMVVCRWGKQTLGRIVKTHTRALAARLRGTRMGLGPVLYFSGPDGCGKTTTINNLRRQLDSMGISYKYMYSLKKFLRFLTRRLIWLKYIGHSRDTSKKGFDRHFQTIEHGDRPVADDWWWRTRKYLALLVGVVDIWLGGCLVIFYRLGGQPVLVETSPYDIFIKYHMPEFVRTERVLAQLIPKPSIGFVLRAEPEDIHKRKPELTAEEIREFYRRLDGVLSRANATPRFVDIDTDTSEASSAAQINNRVMAAIGEAGAW